MALNMGVTALDDPDRLAALRRLYLLDTEPEPAFDRLTRLAAQILDVPMALITLVDANRQFFKSCLGLPEPLASKRETTLSHSFCQHVVTIGEPLIIENALLHPLVADNLAVRDLNIRAYAGFPLTTSEGYILGTLCAIDSQPRFWSNREIQILTDLAASVVTEIELRAELIERKQAEARQSALTHGLRAVLASMDELIALPDVDSVFKRGVEIAREKLGIERCAIFMRDGEIMRGTYGTDIFGKTTDEHSLELDVFKVDSEDWFKELNRLNPDEPQWLANEGAHFTWDGEKDIVVGAGWIAMTAIQSAQKPLGAMVNDAAITGAPLDEIKQEVLAVFCSLLGNIIERKRAEEALRAAFYKEKELNDLKSRFVSMVSHEFRNPLATILSSSSLVKDYAARLSPDKQKGHLEKIQGQVRRLIELLDEMMMISKAESVGLDFNPTPVDLPDLCKGIVDAIQLTTEQHKILFLIASESKPSVVDERLIEKIVNNLLSNAVKYSPMGGEILFKLSYESGCAVLSITDEGIGIPPDALERLYENFFRADNVGHIEGTGLGLSLVKYAVEAHGGTLTCESEVGVGTTFEVRIPLLQQ